jgi:hypothetical protein
MILPYAQYIPAFHADLVGPTKKIIDNQFNFFYRLNSVLVHSSSVLSKKIYSCKRGYVRTCQIFNFHVKKKHTHNMMLQTSKQIVTNQFASCTLTNCVSITRFKLLRRIQFQNIYRYSFRTYTDTVVLCIIIILHWEY